MCPLRPSHGYPPHGTPAGHATCNQAVHENRTDTNRAPFAGRPPGRWTDALPSSRGASRGLGSLLARELLDAGCRVAICGRDAGTLDAAAAQLGHPDRLLALQCDVGNQDEVRTFIDRVRAEFGPVEVLINNAATISVGRVDTMDAEHFESAWRDAFLGTLHPILEVLPEMRARGEGRIANIGSIGGRISFPHLLPYAAAKFAQVGLSEGLRAELADDGIVVTTIIPGFIRTGSFVATDFHDPTPDEYTWFAAGASAPVLTLSPEWVARRVVLAIRHGEADVTLGWFARLGGTLKSLAPGLSADVLGLVDRWILPHGALPEPPAPHESGTVVHADAPEPVLALTAPVVEKATEELNQPVPKRRPRKRKVAP